MTPEELAEVEERARKATAGPWEAANGRGASCVRTVDRNGRAIYFNVRAGDSANVSDETVESWHADARFIAHARADVPALCAEVRRLKDAVAEALTPFAELIGENDRLRHERDAARAEVARLREALDAAQRIVRRKADREAGREET